MSRSVRICVVGATGLIGSRMIERAVSRPDVRLVGVSRREVKLPHGARMEMLLAPVSGWADAIAASGAKVLVCALGTTWQKADKDEAAFRAVDLDLVLACARAAQQAGIGHMIVLSSAGADAQSKHFYLRVKGEMEDALTRLRMKRLDILRPGLLRGARLGDARFLERLAGWVSPVLDLIMFGERRKYHSIGADELVEAIFALAKERAGGRFVHEYDAMRYAIRRHCG
jgi:uncharacterized protein YbjT (DUF2867 family)